MILNSWLHQLLIFYRPLAHLLGKWFCGSVHLHENVSCLGRFSHSPHWIFQEYSWTLNAFWVFLETAWNCVKKNFVNGKKVLLLDPMGTEVLRQTVITKFYALSPIFDNFCLFLSVVLELSFLMNDIQIFEEQYSQLLTLLVFIRNKKLDIYYGYATQQYFESTKISLWLIRNSSLVSNEDQQYQQLGMLLKRRCTNINRNSRGQILSINSNTDPRKHAFKIHVYFDKLEGSIYNVILNRITNQ